MKLIAMPCIKLALVRMSSTIRPIAGLQQRRPDRNAILVLVTRLAARSATQTSLQRITPYWKAIEFRRQRSTASL